MTKNEPNIDYNYHYVIDELHLDTIVLRLSKLLEIRNLLTVANRALHV